LNSSHVALSIRARLTVWYSALLLLALGSFIIVVLWVHWRLLLHQYDEALDTLGVMASNVIEEEFGETSNLRLAAKDTEDVVRASDHVVKVFDVAGHPLTSKESGLALDAEAIVTTAGFRTIPGRDGHPWRVAIRHGHAHADSYIIAIGAPLEEVLEQWRALVKATAIGLPLVLVLGGAGGWWLGRHALRPLTSMAAQARDITARTADSRLKVPHANDELAHLAESFNRVLDRLGNALAEQRRFMADASHELRTPVSIIRTAAEVTLSRPTREPAEYQEALEAVAQQSSRLARLVDDMFVLARADAGGYPMKLAEVDLGELARECVHDLALQAAERRIAVHADVPVGVFIRGDEVLIRRVILNLLHNAIVYTPVGGRVQVTLDASDAVELRVSDSGTGIPDADRDRVFERFVRVDPARAQGGAGLGLAIARWIVEAHGGSLRLTQSGPSGSVFAARFTAGSTVSTPAPMPHSA
jgi:heavy metal sensor kinase